MCGIVGFTGKTNAVPFLLEGLERLEYRGYDSAGIAVMDNAKIATEKTVKRIESLKGEIENNKTINGNIGIGHTRWATHGTPSHDNAHPHLSGNGKFAVVHNGIIENYAILKAELQKEGFLFKSETDTEVIPQLLQKYYNGNLKEAVEKAVSRLEGSYALGIICDDYPDTLVAVKNFSPLIIGIADDTNIIASDVTAIISKTDKVIYIEDGDTAFITPDSCKIYDKNGENTERTQTVITWDVTSAEKGGFDHFMMKEIHEQPDAVMHTVESRIDDKSGEIVFENLKLDSEKLKNIKNIKIIACGSAYHAGIVGKYVFEELLRIPTEVDLASEFRYRNPIVNHETLTIVISQSGETADTLAALKKAKENGSHILSIVNVVGSSIAKASDDVIYTWAGPEIAVATTKGYSTQLAVLYMIAIWAAKRLNSADSKVLDNMLSELRLLPQKIKRILENAPKIEELAEKINLNSSLFFIGRNIDYAVALEGSLKLKEISYIHSEAYAAGELKHGTISLIEEDRIVIALCGYNKLQDKMLSNIKEVNARGAYVIACATEEGNEISKEAKEMIYIPSANPLLMASLEVIPFQLFAYFVSVKRGCDVDKPRNLAKSVTVE